jgi:two-component system NarL family response regulator
MNDPSPEVRPDRIRVLVAEDHFLARFALVEFLGEQGDIVVIAKAESGREAIDLYRAHQPDVVLMDLRLPDLDGFAAIEAICGASPNARVLVLSNFESEEDVHRALRAGARGYLRKDVSGEVLLDAIRRVHAGGRYLPPEVAEKLADRALQTALTARELDVLRLVCKGLSSKQIGAELKLKESTVRIYVSNLLVKLGAKRRTEAIAVAIKRGLVQPNE